MILSNVENFGPSIAADFLFLSLFGAVFRRLCRRSSQPSHRTEAAPRSMGPLAIILMAGLLALLTLLLALLLWRPKSLAGLLAWQRTSRSESRLAHGSVKQPASVTATSIRSQAANSTEVSAVEQRMLSRKCKVARPCSKVAGTYIPYVQIHIHRIHTCMRMPRLISPVLPHPLSPPHNPYL